MTEAMILTVSLTGFTAGVASYFLTPLAGLDEVSATEAARRATLRSMSRTYRWFEPTIDRLAALYCQYSPVSVARLTHRLELLGVDHWRAGEVLAAKQLEATLIALLAAVGATLLFSPTAALLMALLLVLLLPLLMVRGFTTKATRHVSQVRGRLPYALDLMALMLEAGAGTLRECLERVADEHADEPIGQEIRRTLTGVEKGVSAADMLRALDRRLADADVKDMVVAITTAEERGIALKDALRALADRMRQKKVQWMEKSAEQAKVQITGPAMVVMCGCMLIVVAPLLLNAFATAGK